MPDVRARIRHASELELTVNGPKWAEYERGPLPRGRHTRPRRDPAIAADSQRDLDHAVLDSRSG